VDSKPFSGLGILHIPKVLSLAEASIQRQIWLGIKSRTLWMRAHSIITRLPGPLCWILLS
jgi:hypothetical protein